MDTPEDARPFRFGPVPLTQAVGKVLGHNVAGADGRRLLRKGRPLTAEDVAALQALGHASVYVAEPGPSDVGEDDAARRLAEAALGAGLRLVGPHTGRANLVATVLGLFRVDPARLARVNEHDGLTIATLRRHVPVKPGQVVATMKVIPFALPAVTLAEGERLAREGGPLLRVDALPSLRVMLVLSGSPPARERVERDFGPPLRSRIEALGPARVHRRRSRRQPVPGVLRLRDA